MALNEQDGPAFKIKHDPRVTGSAGCCGETSLDELPQLWNVLMRRHVARRPAAAAVRRDPARARPGTASGWT